jgi:hypothetical protein
MTGGVARLVRGGATRGPHCWAAEREVKAGDARAASWAVRSCWAGSGERRPARGGASWAAALDVGRVREQARLGRVLWREGEEGWAGEEF